jgi:uncharacterized protein (UPF0276 family)
MMRQIARDAVGIGLRPIHFADLRERRPGIDFFEVIAENFVGASDLPRRHLARVSSHSPVVGHCISLNLGGTDGLDLAFAARVGELARRHGMPWVTDHLAWTGSGGLRHHDLLPVACSAELVPWVAARIRAVAGAVGLPFGFENPSTYLRFTHDEMPEWEFVRRVAVEADCGLLLDINNVFVTCVNHGWEPRDYLAAIPWERVFYVHLAGHTTRPDGLLHDTHDQVVDAAVWQLYAEAWRIGGPFPTLVEWDDRIPPIDEVTREAQRAREVRA